MTDKFRTLVENMANLPTLKEFETRTDMEDIQAETLDAYIMQAREILTSSDIVEEPHAEMKRLVAMIGASVGNQADPARFLQDLQLEIERIPGANVAFVTRDITWLNDYSYLEDRPELTQQELQAAICQAAAEHEEGAGTQDGVTHYMDEELDRIAPRVDDEPEGLEG